jgi:hypothetical protein
VAHGDEIDAGWAPLNAMASSANAGGGLGVEEITQGQRTGWRPARRRWFFARLKHSTVTRGNDGYAGRWEAAGGGGFGRPARVRGANVAAE